MTAGAAIILLRWTSLPFSQMTAPSSRSRFKVRSPDCRGLATVKLRRKYVVMRDEVGLIAVTGSCPFKSPKPSMAGPPGHAVSGKSLCTHDAPGFVPLSRYFHVDPAAMSRSLTLMVFVAEVVTAPASSVATTDSA